MTCLKTKPRVSLRQRLRLAAEQLDLPEGFLQGEPMLTLDGDRSMMIERHRGIVEYGEERICIAARGYSIEVQGERLRLTAMDGESIHISGRIIGVCYHWQEASC